LPVTVPIIIKEPVPEGVDLIIKPEVPALFVKSPLTVSAFPAGIVSIAPMAMVISLHCEGVRSSPSITG